MPEGSVSVTCIFSIGHIAAFLLVGTLDTPSAPHLVAFLNSEISKKRVQKWEKHGTKYCKGALAYYSSWTRRQSVPLFSLRWACTHWVTQFFGCSAHVCEKQWKPHKYWFRVYKYILVSRGINTESMNNEDWLHIKKSKMRSCCIIEDP